MRNLWTVSSQVSTQMAVNIGTLLFKRAADRKVRALDSCPWNIIDDPF